MSASVNKAIVLGNVGSDPIVRQTDKGMVANISIATNNYSTNETTWHRIVFFGKSAETVSKYIKKGNTIYVEGRIQNKKYTDKNGQEKYTSEIIASNFSILTYSRDAEETKKTIEIGKELLQDDEIPF